METFDILYRVVSKAAFKQVLRWPNTLYNRDCRKPVSSIFS